MENENQELIHKLLKLDPDKPDIEFAYKWGEEFQRIILGMLLCDRYFTLQAEGLIKPKYFTNEVHQLVCQLLMNYWVQYKNLPSKIFLAEEVRQRLREKDPAMQLIYLGELNNIYDFYSQGGVGDIVPGLDSREAILDKITAFAKSMATRTAFFHSLKEISRAPEAEETWAKVDELYKQARSVDRKTDMGLYYFEDLESRYERLAKVEESEDVFTLGFQSINAALHGGGLKRGEIGAVMGLPGTGKTWVKGTKVLMFDGTSKNVEDVAVGDLLMGDDSAPRKVLATHKLFDKVYEVRPTKGDSYFVNSKHILSLKNSHRQGGARLDRPTKRRKNPSFEHHSARMGKTNVYNISVEDWLEQADHFKVKMKGWRVGVDWPEVPVKIDPYILGIWLGDGTSNMPELTNTDQDVLDGWFAEAAKRDLHVWKGGKHRYCMKHGKGRTKTDNSFWDDLASYKLPNNKHIPQAYKINDRRVRLEILAGILDTDGSLSSGGFDFVNKNEVLVNDVLFLARSLGLAAYKKSCQKKCQTGAVGTYFRVFISGDCSVIPTRIPRKKAPKREQVKDVLLTGISVVPHDRLDEFYGFEVDGNHLLLLDDFTVQHNSLTLVLASIDNLIRGHKILYVTTEMDQDRVGIRFDSMMTNIGQHRLMEEKDAVWRALREHVQSYEDKRRLVIKQFPSGSMDVSMLRAYHSQLQMCGFKPDLVVVDYIGDMKDAPGIPTWESRFRIVRDLRGFGVEERHCTLTAVQPNRGASDMGIDEYLDESKQGDSFNQNRVLDLFYTLNQSGGEQKAAVGRIFLAKVRNGKSRFNFRIAFDYVNQTLRIWEISNDVYKMRMSEMKEDAERTVKDSIEEQIGLHHGTMKKTKWQPSDPRADSE